MRCATTRTAAPRVRAASIAAISAASPSASRAELGSSRTRRRGSPNSARARPMRWRWPPESAAAAVGERGLVALGQAADHLVDAGGAGGGDDVGHVGVAEAGDVLADPALEEQRVLRQVADGLAEAGALVGEGALAVEEDAAGGRRPEADDEPGERRLAGAGGADDAEELAGLDAEGDVAHERRFWPAGT